MSNKPTLLTWHDFIAPTGFGNVAKHLLKDAHKDFNVHVVAINSKNKDAEYDTEKFKEIVHTLNNRDPLNTKALVEKAEELQPDVIFLFQDHFNIDLVIGKVKEVSPDSKIVSYFPIDGQPMYKRYTKIFDLSDILIGYSDWANDILKDYYPDLNKPVYKLYHGVDTEVFKPVSLDRVRTLRKAVGWEDKLVFANVNTFQPRKQVDLGLRAFSMFAKGWHRCNECDHIMPRNIKRCELCMSKDLQEEGDVKEDVMLYLHMMTQSHAIGTMPNDNLIAHMENANLNEEDYRNIVAINSRNIPAGEVPESAVNDIYNAADYNFTSTMGEGCGLSLLESAAAGKESIAPKNSAIPEMLGDFGYQVKNKAVANFKQDNGHMRPLVDEEDFVRVLNLVYNKWRKGGKKLCYNAKVIKRINNKFKWEDKREFLMDKLKLALST